MGQRAGELESPVRFRVSWGVEVAPLGGRFHSDQIRQWGRAILSDLLTEILIPVAVVVGIVFSLFQWMLVSKVKLSPEQQPPESGNKNDYANYLIEEEEGLNDHNIVVKCADIQSAISEGATSFLPTEYQYVGVFMVAFAILIFLFLGSVEGFSTKSRPCTYSTDKTCKPALANAIFSTVSFLLGAVTSALASLSHGRPCSKSPPSTLDHLPTESSLTHPLDVAPRSRRRDTASVASGSVSLLLVSSSTTSPTTDASALTAELLDGFVCNSRVVQDGPSQRLLVCF